MTSALLLILFGIFARLNPEHVDNLVPMGAIAVYAGARLRLRWALAVPLVAMIASDLVIDLGYDSAFRRGVFDPTRWTIYGCYLAMVGLGAATCRRATFLKPIGVTILGSLLFYFVTNFAVWATGSSLQPMTLKGLWLCYIDAIPFYRSTITAELVGAVCLFGVDALVHQTVWTKRPAEADAASILVRAE